MFRSNDVPTNRCEKYNICSKTSKLLHLFRTVQEPDVGLGFRAGALFFIILSIPIFSIFVMGKYVYINLFLIVLMFIATTYFLGGTIAFFRNQRKGMVAIFAVNLLSLVLVLVFFLTSLYGYLTDPCYIEPMRCDDQLTDSPAELKGIGISTGVLALFTYMSWRLQRDHGVKTDNEEYPNRG